MFDTEQDLIGKSDGEDDFEISSSNVENDFPAVKTS